MWYDLNSAQALTLQLPTTVECTHIHLTHRHQPNANFCAYSYLLHCLLLSNANQAKNIFKAVLNENIRIDGSIKDKTVQVKRHENESYLCVLPNVYSLSEDGPQIMHVLLHVLFHHQLLDVHLQSRTRGAGKELDTLSLHPSSTGDVTMCQLLFGVVGPPERQDPAWSSKWMHRVVKFCTFGHPHLGSRCMHNS